MAEQDTFESLELLARAEFHAMTLLDAGLSHLENPNVQMRLIEIRNDHSRRLGVLREALESARGGATPNLEPDSLSLPEAESGDLQALFERLLEEERLVCRLHAAVGSHALPERVRRMVIEGRDESVHHVAYLERALMDRPWAGHPGHARMP